MTTPPSTPVAIPPSTYEPEGDVVTAHQKVLLDRADVLALLRVYRTSQGVTSHYRGSPLIERVREALSADGGVPHSHGCPVEQIHRVWTTDQGVDSWVLAEETLRFVETWENRRCTCVGRPPSRPEGVPLTAVYDPDSGLWRPPTALGGSDSTSNETAASVGGSS